MPTSVPHSAPYVVVGAGVAGLTAARLLARDGHRVTVLEGASRIGGKLHRAEVGGVGVDVGAEAMLARRPEGIGLAREVGLEVVHPTAATSRIWTGGRLRPLPPSVMGVPRDLAALERSGVLTAAGLERVRTAEDGASPLDDDVSVGDLVEARLGAEVVDRLVEPLLGGVYAGHARLLSARAAVPQLVEMARRGSLVEQAGALATSDAPVFGGVEGGVSRLPEALAATPGVTVRTSATVRELHRTATGFRLVVGSTIDPEVVEAPRVVLAVPAAPAARLLRELAPVAAAELGTIEYASMAVVTFAFPAADVAAVPALDGTVSGFLVPPVDRRGIKAATFSFAKWGWIREAGDAAGVLLLRASLGRHREEAALQRDDDELAEIALADLREATGLAAAPVDVHVQRWGGGLPQYAVGHLDRVARIRADVARVPGLSVCGAAYDGVGIPACIASARRVVTNSP